jgi:hypothetical protein
MTNLLSAQPDVSGYPRELWGVYVAVEYMSAILVAVGGLIRRH